MDKFTIFEKEQNKKTKKVIKNIRQGIEQEDMEALDNIGEGDEEGTD
jgi:hypothetical protein